MPYEDLKTLLDELTRYANEDGYCVCSVAAILGDMGKVQASKSSMVTLLVKAGCLVEYVSKQQRPKAKPVSLYRITGVKLTRERYEKLFR